MLSKKSEHNYSKCSPLIYKLFHSILVRSILIFFLHRNKGRRRLNGHKNEFFYKIITDLSFFFSTKCSRIRLYVDQTPAVPNSETTREAQQRKREREGGRIGSSLSSSPPPPPSPPPQPSLNTSRSSSNGNCVGEVAAPQFPSHLL